MSKKFELVLGAGGIKGYLHIGLLRAIAELSLPISKITGASVGAIIAALYANGWDHERILKLFLDAHGRSHNPLLLASAVVLPGAQSFSIGQSFLSLEDPWKETCEKLGLNPSDRLRIVTCDAETKKAVLFEGTNYPLGTALSASGALPFVFLPVKYDGKMLIDGAAYHRNPDEFCTDTAIISALGFAKTWPRELLDPISYYYHWRELNAPIVEQPTKVDEEKNVLILHEADDVCGLSFGLSKARCLEMYEGSYKHSLAALKAAIASGKLA